MSAVDEVISHGIEENIASLVGFARYEAGEDTKEKECCVLSKSPDIDN